MKHYILSMVLAGLTMTSLPKSYEILKVLFRLLVTAIAAVPSSRWQESHIKEKLRTDSKMTVKINEEKEGRRPPMNADIS